MPLGIATAGLVAPGQPVADGTARVLAERGLELPAPGGGGAGSASAHRSRKLTADLVDWADLVLGMTRQHVRSAVLLRPAAFRRSFTLRELVARAHELGSRPNEVPLADWLGAAHDGRTAADYLRDEPGDDIGDPIGRPIGAFRALADELDVLTGRLVDLVLAGTGGAGAAGDADRDPAAGSAHLFDT